MTVYSSAGTVNDAPRVALLGTGVMGSGMARNLAAAGLGLRVWNRTPERAEEVAASAGPPEGGTVGAVGAVGAVAAATSVAEAVTGADVVLTMLWDADSVEQALSDGAGSYAEEAVLLQTTTVGAAGADRLAEVAADLGLRYVDAPVLGTRLPAEQGALVVLASGPAGAREVLAPVLDAIGSRTVWLGEEPGAGSRLKLAANTFVLNLTSALAESRAVAETLGVDPGSLMAALHGGPLESPYVAAKGRAMAEEDWAVSFSVDAALKDAALVEAAAGGVARLTRVTAERLAAASAAGHGADDVAALATVARG